MMRTDWKLARRLFLAHHDKVCGRYRNLQSWTEVHGAMRRFLGEPVSPALNMQERIEVRPTQQAPVVRLNQAGDPTVANARWWLVPWFHRGALKAWKATTINARAETVRTAATYRQCFKERRCLVIADGWYEWSGPRDDDPKKKQPCLFTPRGGPIAFAGLWDTCRTEDEGEVESFTIVTQPAGSPLNAYHDRAPVILFGDEWARWLDPSADVDDLLGPESRDRFNMEKASI